MTEDDDLIRAYAAALGRKGGLKGGKARAMSLTPEKRKEIAKLAAKVRWKKREIKLDAKLEQEMDIKDSPKQEVLKKIQLVINKLKDTYNVILLMDDELFNSGTVSGELVDINIPQNQVSILIKYFESRISELEVEKSQINEILNRLR